MGAKGPLTGTKPGSSSSIEVSPARRKRRKEARAAEERRWAARSGPVVVRRADA